VRVLLATRRAIPTEKNSSIRSNATRAAKAENPVTDKKKKDLSIPSYLPFGGCKYIVTGEERKRERERERMIATAAR